MKSTRENSAGFGVMEAVVFAGIASVLVLGTTAMVSRNTWQVKLMNVKAARESLANTVRSQLADPALCTSGLINQTAVAVKDVPGIDVAFTMQGGSIKIQKGSSSPDGVLTISSFRIDKLKNSGLMGASNFPMQVGDMTLDAQSLDAGTGTMTLKPINLGRVYLETNGSSIVSCFNNLGAYGAAAMACIQFGGANQAVAGGTNSVCNTDAFQTAINSNIHAQVNDKMNNTYWNNLMGVTDTKIQIESYKAYLSVVQNAGNYTNWQRDQQNGAINWNFTDLNNRVSAADSDRNARVTNLSGQIDQTQQTAGGAISYANAAVIAGNAANGAAWTANGAAINAENGARNVWGTANLANNNANQARDIASDASAAGGNAVTNANQALANANLASSISQQAIGNSNYANYVANVAANTAQQSYNYAVAAYNTSNASYQSSANIMNVANDAYNIGVSAHNTGAWAAQTAAQANQTSMDAYYRPANQSYTQQYAYDCSQMQGFSCP